MNISVENEKRIEELLKEMTLEEKVAMCHANSKFYSEGCERLGIDELAMMDGPHGVRSETMRDEWTSLRREEDRCTYLPTGTALAATFNPKLGRRFGETLGSEARHRGKDIILGPGVNIIRTPLCGRNFEYMSEDPCLIEKMSPELVKGIESQDVSACVKHYALNNQELARMKTNALVSRRALHEIYLRGFYAAIMEGGASSVMGAYNCYEGQHLCHHKYLVKEVLKERWGFRGVYLTDWAGCHDTEEAIFNGLDLEMGTQKPYNEYYLADAFLARAKESEEVRAELDEKVRRILRLMFSVNHMSPDRKKGEFNTKEHQQTAYDVAAEAMVLLKNEDGLLPLDKKKIKKLLVVGENAILKHAAGGASSGVQAFYEIPPLEGIQRAFGDECEVEFERGTLALDFRPIPMHLFEIVEEKAGVRGYRKTVRDLDAEGNVVEKIDFTKDIEITDPDAKTHIFTGQFRAPESGLYRFRIASNVSVEMILDGKMVAKRGVAPYQARANSIHKIEYSVELAEDQLVDLKLVAHNFPGAKLTFDFGWITPSESASVSSMGDLERKAKEADAVIFCAGLGHNFDTEGRDRLFMNLLSEQDLMIQMLAALNPNLIVTITAGSPVTMPWLDLPKSVVWAWYAGMEGGNVLGDVLAGNICPSGKMPFTLPVRYEDSPVVRYGEYLEDDCHYYEDIFVGYRGFEKDDIKPLFPFGHGLSYAKFEYSDLTVTPEGEGATVSFKLTNVGDVTAKESAQLYIGDPVCSVVRPKKELRGFEKVELAAGETKTVTIPVTAMDLSFFDEQTETWKLEKGEFTVYVGSSSADIRLEGSFTL